MGAMLVGFSETRGVDHHSGVIVIGSRTTGWRWRLAITLLTLNACLLVVGSARAGCTWPSPLLVWSYPADGQRNVPPDADLIMILEGDPVQEVLLDGAPLSASRNQPNVYDMGDLAPSEVHTLELHWGEASRPPQILSFETGDGTVPSRHADLDTFASSAEACNDYVCGMPGICQIAALVNTCFDTGPPVSLALATDGHAAAWIVELELAGQVTKTVLPGNCKPTALAYPIGQMQVKLTGIGQDGSTITTGPQPYPTTIKPSRCDSTASRLTAPAAIGKEVGFVDPVAPNCGVDPARPQPLRGHFICWVLLSGSVLLQWRRKRR